MFLSSFLAGYFLVLSYGQSITTIPSEYQNKPMCENAALVAQSGGWRAVCIPTDTHTANQEFD